MLEKSKYGKETAFLYRGNLTNEQVSLSEVHSTLNITHSEKDRLKIAFDEAKAKNPQFFDGLLWRYEGHNVINGGVEFLVSPTSYMSHNIRRNEIFSVAYENGRFISGHVNPFSINAVQKTADGYILIGVKSDKKSDQKGLGVMGAGFIKRKEGFPPEDIFVTTLRECNEETSYNRADTLTDNHLEDFRFLGNVFGSNHDTTACIYVPLNAIKTEVGIKNQEHSDLLFLKTDMHSLETFLNESGMKGIIAVDHLLGDIQLYYNALKEGSLK